jgi:hypothetical protein
MGREMTLPRSGWCSVADASSLIGVIPGRALARALKSLIPNRGYGFRAPSRSLSSGRPEAGPVGSGPGMTETIVRVRTLALAVHHEPPPAAMARRLTAPAACSSAMASARCSLPARSVIRAYTALGGPLRGPWRMARAPSIATELATAIRGGRRWPGGARR